MLRWFALVPVALIAGCAMQPSKELSLAHAIDVPKQYQQGADAPPPGLSPIERYVSGYDIGWWAAVGKYRQDIDFCDPSQIVVGGWPDEQIGGCQGYYDARIRIETLIQTFGKQRVSLYLQQFQVGDDN